MKSFIFLTLVALFSGFTWAEETTDRDLFNFSTTNIQCLLALKKYGTCLYELKDITNTDITKACTKFDNDNCKEFVNDVYQTTTDCQDEETIDNFIKQVRYIYITGCSKDENGNLCPLTDLIQNQQNALNGNIDISIVQKSCSSENCKNQLYHMIELLPSTKEYVENTNNNQENTEKVPEELIDATYKNINTDQIKQYLDSEVCSKVSTNNDTVTAAGNDTALAGNQTLANSTSAGFILSSNTSLFIVTLLLVTFINQFF